MVRAVGGPPKVLPEEVAAANAELARAANEAQVFRASRRRGGADGPVIEAQVFRRDRRRQVRAGCVAGAGGGTNEVPVAREDLPARGATASLDHDAASFSARKRIGARTRSGDRLGPFRALRFARNSAIAIRVATSAGS